MKPSSPTTRRNIFLRMHPLQRILISVIASVITFFLFFGVGMGWVLDITILWDVFALTFITTSWIVLFTRPLSDIVKQANKDDGSRAFVLGSILVASFASMFAVLMLLTSKEHSKGNEAISVPLAVAGMILSWVMVHTLFTFHYAHLYYNEYSTKKNECTDLSFPGDEEPDYLDFAYFAFVIGMTFQVSDVEITSRKIRRTALAHGLLAFALNTFVVALTINLVGGR